MEEELKAYKKQSTEDKKILDKYIAVLLSKKLDELSQ